ncbi:GM12161 [Drosophila sechellia]|uniref:GM12161 n=1 Tax=Drosophila sechellia TaxID=7238 RepID=B4HZQ2_DROSE|nr:GM12161 [Drosophila sechellia]
MNSLKVNEFDAAPEASPNRNPSVDSGPGFVRLKTRQKKLLRKALHGGLTREKALEVVQALPIVKGTPTRSLWNPSHQSVPLGFS